MTQIKNVLEVDYKEEMEQSYIDYSMSVITGRALPDIRDGLKPVQRRIIWAMHQMGITPDKPHRKSARIVGEVLGKYHPHGDSAVYDATVRMAQDFSLREPLIDGQGNFGSMDGDKAAAMRYTEVRLTPLCLEMTRGIDKDTVGFMDNFDGEEKEPIVLPSRYPNLLVNGSSGIAVGMATNIPSHNLKEVSEAVCYLIDHPEATTYDLLKYIKGPDFPTGGQIVRDKNLIDAYETGSGTIQIRGKAEIVKENGKSLVVITEVPQSLAKNKLKLLNNIGELDDKKKIEGISEIRDESNEEGVRIVVELKRGADPEDVLNRLYKFSKLSDTFSFNITALVDSQPKVLSLKECLQHYISFQEIITRREASFNLAKAQSESEIYEGLVRAVSCLDEVITCIRASKNPLQARKVLTGEGIEELEIPEPVKIRALKAFVFSDKQAQAILDLRLQKLTRLEADSLLKTLEALQEEIKQLNKLLDVPGEVAKAIKGDLKKLAKAHETPRRSEIISSAEVVIELKPVEKDDTPGFVIIDDKGYIKWVTSRSTGEDLSGIRFMEPVSKLQPFILIDQNGVCIRMSIDKIPEAKWKDKGKQLSTIVKLDEVIAVLPVVEEDCQDKFLIMATSEGMVKKTDYKDYLSLTRTAKGIKLKEGDKVCKVLITNDLSKNIILGTSGGLLVRFPIEEIPLTARYTGGVVGIKIQKDKVVGAGIAPKKATIVLKTAQDLLIEFDQKEIPKKRAVKGKKFSTEPIIALTIQNETLDKQASTDDYQNLTLF